MPRVIFLGGPMEQELVCAYETGAETTILQLARSRQVPIYWRCAQGTCCACAARVTAPEGQLVPLGRKERNVLAREKFPIDPLPAAPGQTTGSQTGWRLTCEYRLSGEDLRVEW